MTARAILVLLSLLLPALAQAGIGGPEPLTLRVHDVTVTPGGRAAVVLRTYASRPIRQGQICFSIRSFFFAPDKRSDAASGVTGPFVELQDAIVFSTAGDAIEQADLFTEGDAQITVLTFDSESATVNATDGPMLVLFYRARPDLVPGTRLTIDLDLPNTALFDEQGQPVPIADRDGELRVRAPSEPVSLAIASEEPQDGTVLLSLQTDESMKISAGQFAFNYPPVVTGHPKVFIDPRHGTASPTVFWLRGQIAVRFESPDNSLGEVPGDIVGIAMKMLDGIDPEADRRLWLDPAQTFLYDGSGATVTLDLEGDVIP